MELVTALHAAGLKEQARSTKVSLANVCAIVMHGAPVSLTAGSVSSVGRCVLSFMQKGQGHLVEELCQFHSAHIDPQALSVTHGSFEAVVKHPNLDGAPLAKHYIIRALYSAESVQPRQRPQPDM